MVWNILRRINRNVFAPLKDIKKFLSGYLHYGAVTWNVDGKILDLAPDTMYEEIKCNNGIYVLGSRHATH